MRKKKIIILISGIILTFLAYFIIGCYIYKKIEDYGKIYIYTFVCKYDKDNLCNSVLKEEEYYLERELERIQINQIKKFIEKESPNQITFCLSNVSEEQLKKVKMLVNKLNSTLRIKIRKGKSSGEIFLTMSINERKVVENFFKMISLLTTYRTHRVYDNYLWSDIKVIKKDLNTIEFKLGLWVKMNEKLKKSLYSNLPLRLLFPPQMNFKFIKYALCGSEYLLKDDEVKDGMMGEGTNKLEPFCLQKKEVFSKEDIKFIHSRENFYTTPYIAISFNEGKNTEICNEIDQSPYKLIAFLVDDWIYAIFDSFDIRAINEDGEIESISSSSAQFNNVQEIQIGHDSKSDIENVTLFLKYGRFNIPLKPIKDSVRVEPTLLYRTRILVYPIHSIVEWFAKIFCF